MVRLNSSLSSLVARRKSLTALPTCPMISGSLAGPNTISARTTINRSSMGPMPRIFIAARLCRPDLSSVDYIPLGSTEDLVSERAVGGFGGGDPHLALVGRLGFGDALQDVLAALRV